MADLANISQTYTPNAASILELRAPDDSALLHDDGTPMTLSLLGADSDVAVKARNSTQNRRLQQGVRAKLTAEGLDADGATYLAKLTVGWSLTMGGEKPAFSYEAAVKLYTNPAFAFIREQADTFVADRANFLKASSTN